MLRERIADDIYVFTSERYLEVTAGAIVTDEGAVVIDTLPFPDETQRMREFVLKQSPQGIRYLIVTHSHGDHSYGSYQFVDSEMIAHLKCWETLSTKGVLALRRAQRETPELADVSIRLPPIVFEESLTLRLGDKTIRLLHSPGHTVGLSVVHIKEDRVLFGSDAIMPVPYVVDGDNDTMVASLHALAKLTLEAIVQGHGRVLLRGEIPEAISSSVDYIRRIETIAREAVNNETPKRSLMSVDIETCGKSRIPLDGMVQRLHQANLLHLYDTYATGHD